ncbi:beta propeller repeat protein [Treponema pectinovorum]|uniref:hypothetical protein n=1 Tax=Treponema pectinovorum TaxID=164 RepID=UPI0011CB784C|nr:hypothetical protein [Treponema pectinovorum]
MKAIIYKNLSSRYEVVEIKSGQTVAQTFKDIDFSNAVVVVNDGIKSSDYVLKENDIVTIRMVAGVATTTLLVIGIIAALGVGVYAGYKGYQAKKAAEKAQEDLEKVKKLSNNAGIDNRPFLRGASNAVATGNSQPYIIGRHFFTPYLLSKPFYKITGVDGADQYTYTALECGFSKQIIQKISIDDIIIKKFDNNQIQEGAFNLDTGIFAEDGSIEIAQDGALFDDIQELNYKVDSKSCNDEIPRNSEIKEKSAEPLTYTLNPCAKDVDVAITFPNGLFAYDNSNNKIKTKVTITPQFSLDGGKTWSDFYFNQAVKPAPKKIVHRGTYRFFGDETEDYIKQHKEEWQFLNGEDIKNSSLEKIEISPGFFENSFIIDVSYTQTIPVPVQKSNSNVFERLVSSKEIRSVAHCDFTADNYNTLKQNNQSAILIRLTNDCNKDSKISNSCYCIFYQSICFDSAKSIENGKYKNLVPSKIVEDRERAYCTILGLKLKASKINEEKLKKINIITQGVARTWNGEEWSKTKTATRNPAAWALEVLTSDCHKASKYDDSEIDLESFGDFYDYCENPENSKDENHFKFSFDWVITQNTKKDDVLNYIMDSTGATLYYDLYGRKAVAIDRPQENALAVYNPQNIIKINHKKEFKRKTDALRIKYTTSKNDLFQEETYIVMKEINGVAHTLNENSIIRDLTVTGVTEHEHIVRYARRLMAREALSPKTTVIEVGNEGIFYTPFSKVLIQDDSLKAGSGNGYTINKCKWYAGILKRIYSNEVLEFEENKKYGVIINCFTQDGVKPVALKVSGTGRTKEFAVVTQLKAVADAIPEPNNIFSFGELDENGNFTKITREFTINTVRKSDKGFTLELLDYNKAIYETGTIPSYESNITPKIVEQVKPIPPQSVTKEELIDTTSNATASAVKEAVNSVTHGIRFTNVFDISNNGDTIDSLREALDEVLKQTTDGISLKGDEIVLQVEDTEKALRSTIAMTSKQILAQVDDMKRELTGAIDIQAGAVRALVEGAGSTGKMSLSLELPVLIDTKLRAKFVKECGEDLVNDVYAKLYGTDNYTIKPNATSKAIKSLWEKAVKAGLLASQIELNAEQIAVYNGDKKAAAFINGKLQADFIDVEKLIVQNLKIDSDKNSNSDFEATLNKTEGLLIKNQNKEILKVDPATGKSIFTGEISAGAVQLLDTGVYLKDGEVSVINNGWKGSIKPTSDGVEFAIYGGDEGKMKKKQLYTFLAGGLCNLLVLGNIISCKNVYSENPNVDTTVISSGTNGYLSSVAWNGNTWVAVGEDSTILRSTDDGLSWQKIHNGGNPFFYSVACNGNTWVVIGRAGTILRSTDNGLSWQIIQSEVNPYIHFIACNGSTWIATEGVGTILRSTDNGLSWQKIQSGVYMSIESVAWNGNTWVAVGGDKTILRSTDDGLSWQKIQSEGNRGFYSVACNGNTWVAVGYKGAILRSTDNGSSWQIIQSGTARTLKSVVCYNDNYIVVGEDGIILKSIDNGSSWQIIQSGTNEFLTSVAYSDSTWICVGGKGYMAKINVLKKL